MPNGPLPRRTESTERYSREVTNRRSLFTDHTSYWENSEQVLYRCVCEAGAAAGLSLETLGDRAANGASTPSLQLRRRLWRIKRRRWRTGCLLAARRGALIFSIVLPERLWNVSIGAGLLGFLHDKLKGVLGNAFTLQREQAPLVFAAVWLVYFVAAGIWRIWDRGEADCLHARKEYDVLSAPMSVFGFLTLAGFEFGFMLMLRPRDELVTPALFAAAGAFVLGLMAAGLVKMYESSDVIFDRNWPKWILFYWLVLFPFAPWISGAMGIKLFVALIFLQFSLIWLLWLLGWSKGQRGFHNAIASWVHARPVFDGEAPGR